MKKVIKELELSKTIAENSIKNAKAMNLPILQTEQFIRDCDKAIAFLEVVSAQMPNGFTSWHKTHFEVVAHIRETAGNPGSIYNHIQKSRGSAGLYKFAAILTSKFEVIHLGKTWDNTFVYVVHDFLERQDINWFKDEI